MIHAALVALIASAAAVLPAQAPAAVSTQGGMTLEDLVALMRDREKLLQSAVLEVTTTGSYPGGATLRIDATIRVLGKTHFHLVQRFQFEDGMSAEHETVRTPEGVWIRELDPGSGEVYLHMERELFARLRAASDALGEAGDTSYALGNAHTEMRGAEMLRSLSRSFDLRVEPRDVKGQRVFVVKGDARTAAAETADAEAADHVEVIVRPDDFVVMQMVQFRAGKEQTRVELTKVEINRPVDAASFRMDLPEGRSFIDIMDHPESAAHVRYLLERAEAAKGKAEAGTPTRR